MKSLTIKSFDLIPLDIPLTDNFVISQGKVTIAQNIILRINLNNGICGYGEITPFPELAGADRASCLKKADETGQLLFGKDITSYRNICHEIQEFSSDHSSVICGFETAMLDALTRTFGISLDKFFGGRLNGPFETDITIPILSLERSYELAAQWYSKGFRKLKMKVGIDFDKELKLIREINKKYPEFRFIIDANQAFAPSDAIRFANELSATNVSILMFEQPVHKKDIEGLAEVKKSISFPVAADEAVFSKEDLKKVIDRKAADIINLKIMKMGLLDAWDMAITAYTMGFKLMIGGMVETRLAMGTSLALVAGLGIIDNLDLDTPLLMAMDPLEGGYHYKGPIIHLSGEPGLGIKLKENQ